MEVTAPFTKVEESFNVQASHDLMAWKDRIHQYDHHEFTGVVPRTFAGAVVLGGMSSWLGGAMDVLSTVTHRDRLMELHAVRCSLGFLVCLSVWFLGRCLPVTDLRTHRLAASLLMVMTGLTYHVAFYASRTLPNTFALVLVNCSVGLLLQNRPRCGFALLAGAAAVFRSDVLVFIAPLALVSIAGYRSIGIISGACAGILGALAALVVSVPLDSVFWGRLLWPEAVVLLFNTVENKSSEWGTSPFHWYFTSALPKGFMLMTPFVFLAPLFTGYCRREFISAVVFIVLYSFLPHKEVRFILIVFPVLLCPAACGIAACLVSIGKRRVRWWASLAILLGLFAAQTAVIGAFHILANRRNYPGGDALLRVMARHDSSRASNPRIPCGATVYIDAHAGMTGVSRFAKRMSSPNCLWVFNKDPVLFNSTAGVYETRRRFDYLVVREGDKEWHAQKGLYRWVEDVDTVGGLQLKQASVGMVPFLSIWELKRHADVMTGDGSA